jgi:hypothetical protein
LTPPWRARLGWGFAVVEPDRGSLISTLARLRDDEFETRLTERLRTGTLTFAAYKALYDNVPFGRLAAAIVFQGLEFERPFRLGSGRVSLDSFSARAAEVK